MKQSLPLFVLQNSWRAGIIILLLMAASKKHIRFQLNLGTNTPLSQKTSLVPSTSDDSQAQASISQERFQLIGGFGRQGSPKGTNRFLTNNIDPEAQDAFIRRFAQVAEAEQKKYGIPASVVLIMGLLHGQAGYDQRVRDGNNYFGLPCSASWRGASMQIGDSCFRVYETPWMSFRDFSQFAVSIANVYPEGDYKDWISALRKRDYPENPNWSKRAVKLIEELELTAFDN